MAVPERTLGALKLEVRESLIARTVQLPIQEFIHTQGVSSAFLLIAAVAAMVWANSPWKDAYYHAWHIELTLSGLRLPVHEWINDAMMALFFFLMGMEIKREMVHGELADIRRASLPLSAALGGMVIPALIYAALNYGRGTAHGWGVPMATDIAFSLGVLALLKGVPAELKVFLLTLAIADDIGAIVVIAVFYTSTLHWNYLLIAGLLISILLLCRKLGFGKHIFYTALGFCVWLAVLRSGVHATIAGVVLGLLMPVTSRVSLEEFSELGASTIAEFREARAAGDRERANRVLGAMEYLLKRTESPADRVTRELHDWIAFLVLPLFALANAGVTFFSATWGPFLHSPVAWGVLLGLLLGKPLGIVSACWITVKLGIGRLPGGVNWKQVTGVGVLSGIGFTVSLFIGGLAFEDQAHLDAAKTAVLFASLLAGVGGYFLLRRTAAPQPKG
jgi:NhaA family Na+:H+ antiporter